MSRWFSGVAIAVACGALVAVSVDADARRMGGGRSMGVQREAVPPRPSQPPAQQAAPGQSAPANQAAAPAAAGPNAAAPATAGGAAAAAPGRAASPAAAPGATPPRSGMSRWLGPIAGIAAGLGLAALLSHLGLSEAFASVLLLVLLAVAAVMLVRWLMRRNAAASQPMQYAGASAGAGGGVPFGYGGSRAPTSGPLPPPASGRLHTDGPSVPAAMPAAIPEGFDGESFVRHAKMNFNRLQAAYDRGDTASIAEFTTPEMLAEIRGDIAGRGTHHATEVVRLDAQIVEVKTEADRHWVGVRFTGLTREDGSQQATPFDEVWNLTKPVDGSSGWLLAGIQQVA